ncbi:MAG: hypothetical protein COT55_03155 [Candidatus Diapherotrites archaeon CG09_land_8_20_14_0_10_32_12]|nr:MAG: hypothetical protein COT55_03155 [Candidatus Diapherotrites archaeon CG09_land_8_20_14_0_10_32_12]
MINLEQRDIALVNFPFSNQIQVKFRPVVIISNNSYNKSSDDLLCIAVSSVGNENNYNLSLKNNDLVSGNLKEESKIKCDTITLIEKELFKKKIGTVTPAIFEKVKERINALIS